MAEKTKCKEVKCEITVRLSRKQSTVYLEAAEEELIADYADWQIIHPGEEYPKPLARIIALIREEIELRQRGGASYDLPL